MQKVNPGNAMQMALRTNDKARGDVCGSANQPIEIKVAQTHQDDGQHAKPAGRLRQHLPKLFVNKAGRHYGADDKEEVEVDHDGDAVVSKAHAQQRHSCHLCQPGQLFVVLLHSSETKHKHGG